MMRPSKHSLHIFAAIIGVLFLVADFGWILGQETSNALERQRAVEAGLLPEVVAARQPISTWNIWDRMEHHRVPGVSIAVINDGVVVMTNGEGGRELRMEVVRAVSRVYAWPHYIPSVRYWWRIALMVAGAVLIAVTVILLTVRRIRSRRTLRA